MDEDIEGLTIWQMYAMPASNNDEVFGCSYYELREFGTSSDGHRFADALSESEKQKAQE